MAKISWYRNKIDYKKYHEKSIGIGISWYKNKMISKKYHEKTFKEVFHGKKIKAILHLDK